MTEREREAGFIGSEAGWITQWQCGFVVDVSEGDAGENGDV